MESPASIEIAGTRRMTILIQALTTEWLGRRLKLTADQTTL